MVTTNLEGKDWHKRCFVVSCTTAAAYVSRFVIDINAYVAKSLDSDDDDDVDAPPAVGRNYQVFVRLSVGPMLEIAGKPGKRGIRIDSWVGMTHEPDAEKYEGATLDEGNEIILSRGSVALLKLPKMESEEICVFPGLGLMVEWTDPLSHILIMPTSAMPLHMCLITPVMTQESLYVSGVFESFIPARPPQPKKRKAEDKSAPVDDAKD